MAYTTVAKVRLLTNLTTSDISDADVTSLITEATKEVNSRLNVKIVRERAEFIDSLRENKVDGTNATYYVINWKGKFLADHNNDGSISASDVTVTIVASDNSESSATISSITHNEGKIVLSSAPSSTIKNLLIDYSWSYFDESTPNPQVELATTYLVAAYAYAKIQVGGVRSIRIGSMGILRSVIEATDFFYKRYETILGNIINSKLSDYKEAEIF